MQMYREPIGRFVVECLENYARSSEHRQALVEAGIDPEDNWLLVWSFRSEADAWDQMSEECGRDSLERRWRVRDRGADAPGYIERPIY